MKTKSLTLAAGLGIVTTVIAGESADYSITPQAQAAGGSVTSSNYTVDTSVMPGGATASAGYTARGGFAGSLYDAVALDVTAPAATVNEGATLQLSAALVLDDATRLVLPPSGVTWSVSAGPGTVNPAGLFTAGLVSGNTAATVQGTRQSLTDTVSLTILNDGGYDYASDEIPDDWQTQYFGPANPDAAPGADPDHDGWNNLFEYTAGLVPPSDASVFHIAITPVPDQPEKRRIIFSPRLPGRTYTVLFSTSLMANSWQPVPGATVSDSGDVRTVTDPSAAGPRRFYRVEILRP